MIWKFPKKLSYLTSKGIKIFENYLLRNIKILQIDKKDLLKGFNSLQKCHNTFAKRLAKVYPRGLGSVTEIYKLPLRVQYAIQFLIDRGSLRLHIGSGVPRFQRWPG